MPTRSVTPFSPPDSASGLRARAGGFRRPLLRLTAPLHPILVHFTIALTTTALAFDLLAFVFGLTNVADVGWWTLAAAIFVTPATLATGIKSRLRLPVEEGQMRSFLRAHMALGPALFGLLIVLGIWRGRLWQSGAPATTWYLASLAAVTLAMAVQGYLGGELVYRFGAEVKSRYRELSGRKHAVPRKRSAEVVALDSAPRA